MFDDEKRRQARIPVDEEISVRDIVSGKELGILANIHVEGFMLISDGGLKEDNLYQIRLEVNSDKNTEDCSIGAECLWISDTGTGDQVWAGFQIMEMSDSAKELIESLVDHYDDEE